MANHNYHGYGRIPDEFDIRDKMFTDHPGYASLAAAPLPPFTLNRFERPIPIRDQGQEGSCTGHGIARAVQLERMAQGLPSVNFSPAFIYYEERAIEGSTTQDAGAMIRDGIKVVAKQGVCAEATFKYVAGAFTQKPPTPAVAEAAGFKIKAYHRITTVPQAKVALAAKKPVIIGFTVYASFEQDWHNAVATDGAQNKEALMPMPARHEGVLGGHCVCVEDYADDATAKGGGALVAANSWGIGWETSGYFAIPYAFWAAGRISDCWAIDVA